MAARSSICSAFKYCRNFFPIQEINKNMLKVKGLSSTILRLDCFENNFGSNHYFGVVLGINYLVTGLILISFISYMAIVFIQVEQ